jgi:hypothetical protein
MENLKERRVGSEGWDGLIYHVATRGFYSANLHQDLASRVVLRLAMWFSALSSP